jgi:hypothetical protein
LESNPLKNRSISARLATGLFLASASLGLTACRAPLYYHPENNYAGRPTPPSGLLQRVLASYTANGSSGGLEILDGYRDLRGNIQNTIKSYFISGYSSAQPVTILNFPEQTTGYVVSYTDGGLGDINYSKEASVGSVASFGSQPPSVAAAPNGTLFAGAAEQAGILSVTSSGATYQLYLPNVDKVVIDSGATTLLAMVRNSNALYRVVKLPATNTPNYPPGYVDCEPLLLPVYCVVPVAGTYDHPTNAVFSLDGSTAYILNSGPEYSGTTASVTFLLMSALNINNVPTVNPLSPTAPSPLTPLPVANPIPVPGGVTAALSDGNYLYLAGQQLQTSGPYTGLFAGNLSLLNLSTYTVGAPISISDGTHTKMVFADNSTLWIGSTQCANGVRAAKAAAGILTQDANDNCLTRYVVPAQPGATANQILPGWSSNSSYNVGSQISDGVNLEVAITAGNSGGSTPSWNTAVNGTTNDGAVVWEDLGPVTVAQVIPAVTPNNTTASTIAVQYPNTNQNNYYYGSLTGLCWVQTYGKVYTAYGGQIHAFNTVDGSERDNYYITIQGTVYDVAYMDALTNSAD